MNLTGRLSTLESAGLIRLAQLEPDLEYLFRHALVQDAAYALLLDADRQRLHQAVGTVVEHLYSSKLDEYAAMLARHFERAGDDQQAHKYFVLAGTAALASYANQEAESQFQSALALSCCESEQAALLEGLGEALYRQSRFAEALQAWREGISLYQSLGNDSGLARLYAHSARVAWHSGNTPESLRISQEGLAQVTGVSESPDLALLMHEAARACLFNGLPDDALPLCRKALDMAERLGAVDVQADALATLGVLPDLSPTEVLEALTKAVELAENSGLLRIAVRAHHNLGVMKSGLEGAQQAARRHYLRATEIAQKRGVASEELFSLVNAAEVSLGLANLSEVEMMLPRFDRLLEDIADPAPFQPGIDGIRAGLLWMRGKKEQSLQLSYSSQTEARRRGDLQRLLVINNALILELFELHKFGKLEVLEEIEILLSEVIKIGERGLGGRVSPYCQMSILRARQQRTNDAQRWLARAKEAALAQPSFWNDVALRSAEVELAVAERRWTDALTNAEELVGKHVRIGTRWSCAQTLRDWADIHLLRGEPVDLHCAQSLLREALALYGEMGAPRHKALTEEYLRALKADIYTQSLSYQKDAQELTQAGLIQASFLPEKVPDIPGWQLAASVTPAKKTSGDFYDFIHLAHGRLGIVIADVTDKGAAAALFMTSGRTLIHAFALEHPDQPKLVIGKANRRMTLDTHEGLFITVFYGVLNPAEGTLTYCNAGHNPPFLLREAGRVVQTLTRTGMPIGVLEDATWQQKRLQISPGNVLVLYTDGVTEGQNPQKSVFGEERLLAAAQSSIEMSAQDIHDVIRVTINEFASGAPQFDDISLVILSRDNE